MRGNNKTPQDVAITYNKGVSLVTYIEILIKWHIFNPLRVYIRFPRLPSTFFQAVIDEHFEKTWHRQG